MLWAQNGFPVESNARLDCLLKGQEQPRLGNPDIPGFCYPFSEKKDREKGRSATRTVAAE